MLEASHRKKWQRNPHGSETRPRESIGCWGHHRLSVSFLTFAFVESVFILPPGPESLDLRGGLGLETESPPAGPQGARSGFKESRYLGLRTEAPQGITDRVWSTSVDRPGQEAC